MLKKLIMTLIFLTILGGVLYYFSSEEKAELIPLESSNKATKALFQTYSPLRPLPDIKISNEKGESLTLNDFRGQNLLVNFWATWCAPCRVEMPDLEALQAAKGNADFKVIIISVDRGGLAASRKFLNEIGIKNLDLYYDEKGTLARQMKAKGYPTSILITKKGKQYGGLTGPAHWNSASAYALIDRLIASE